MEIYITSGPTILFSMKRVSTTFMKCNIMLIIFALIMMLFTRQTRPVDPELQSNYCKPTQTVQIETVTVPESGKNFHSCNYGNVPYVTGELAAAQLLRYTNFSLARFGDVDIELIQGITWPSQQASAELSQSLLRVLRSNISSLMIGIYDVASTQSRTSSTHQDWMQRHPNYKNWLLENIDLNRQYFPTLLSSPYQISRETNCIFVEEVYNNLREVWRNKNVVLVRGANNQVYEHDVYDTAKTQTVIYAPPVQAWSSYNYLKKKVMAQSPSSLYILSAGPVAKVLVYDLVMAGRRALDLGHLAKDYNIFQGNKTFPDHFYLD